MGDHGDILRVVWETAAVEVAGYEKNLDNEPGSSYRFVYENKKYKRDSHQIWKTFFYIRGLFVDHINFP